MLLRHFWLATCFLSRAESGFDTFLEIIVQSRGLSALLGWDFGDLLWAADRAA